MNRVDAEIVAYLEGLLDRAKSGEIKYISFVHANKDGSRNIKAICDKETLATLGAIDCVETTYFLKFYGEVDIT